MFEIFDPDSCYFIGWFVERPKVIGSRFISKRSRKVVVSGGTWVGVTIIPIAQVSGARGRLRNNRRDSC